MDRSRPCGRNHHRQAAAEEETVTRSIYIARSELGPVKIGIATKPKPSLPP
jgi:hypothetical protein